LAPANHSPVKYEPYLHPPESTAREKTKAGEPWRTSAQQCGRRLATRTCFDPAPAKPTTYLRGSRKECDDSRADGTIIWTDIFAIRFEQAVPKRSLEMSLPKAQKKPPVSGRESIQQIRAAFPEAELFSITPRKTDQDNRLDPNGKTAVDHLQGPRRSLN
jgi:hypothetical protein